MSSNTLLAQARREAEALRNAQHDEAWSAQDARVADLLDALGAAVVHLTKVIDDAARHWTNADLRIPWEGGLDAAMAAAVATIAEQRRWIDDSVKRCAERQCATRDRRLAEAYAEIARLAMALEWYGEQARLARLVHSEGDAGRHALVDDGGRRARTVLLAALHATGEKR